MSGRIWSIWRRSVILRSATAGVRGPWSSWSLAPGVTQSRLASSAASEKNSAPSSLLLSDTCVQRLQELRQKEPKTILRIIVEGGGCSGFQYRFDLEDDPVMGSDDKVIAREGAEVVIDETSLDLLSGSTVDFHRELIRAGFRITDNPQAEGGCSCGVSFSVKGV